MKVFTARNFPGHWPVGTAAVIVAETKERALELLNIELANQSLEPAKEEDVEPVRTLKESCTILCNGDY